MKKGIVGDEIKYAVEAFMLFVFISALLIFFGVSFDDMTGLLGDIGSGIKSWIWDIVT